MRYKKILLIIIIVFSMILLAGCGNISNSSNDLKSKVKEEINYLDNKIISIANHLNGIYLENYKVETREISSPESNEMQGKESGGSSGQNSSEGEQSQSDSSSSGSEQETKNNKNEKIIVSEMKTTSILAGNNKDIDWENIKTELELMYNTWATITLDLYKLNISGDIINEFSSQLNNVTVNIKNENVGDSLEALANLYSYLPIYLQYAAEEKEDINIKETKLHVLLGYSYVNNDNWNNVVSEVNYALTSYTPVISNLEFTKRKEHATNRIYILLNEMKNSLNTNDKEIFYINYKNVMNELNIL